MSMIYSVNLNLRSSYPTTDRNQLARIAMGCVHPEEETEAKQQIIPSELPENKYHINEDGTFSVNIKTKTQNLKLFLDPNKKTAETESGKFLGKLELEKTSKGRYVFDITPGKGQKRLEIFGALDESHNVSFVCVTEYTPFSEKKRLSLLMTALKRGEYISSGDSAYLNKILWRLRDKKMLDSLLEDFTALFKASKQPQIAEYLISFIENSVLNKDNDTFDSLANTLLPLIGNEDRKYGLGIAKLFRAAMARGKSRRFMELMVMKLEHIINDGSQRDKIRAAMILTGIESDKAVKNRFYSDVPKVLKLILKVVKKADEKGQQEISCDLEYLSHFFDIDQKSAHLVIDIVETLLKNKPKNSSVINNTLSIINFANMTKVNARGLIRLYKLIKPFTDQYWYGTRLLGMIASHANAPEFLVRTITNSLMNLAIKETDITEKLAIIQTIINVFYMHENTELFIWQIIKIYEKLSKTNDGNTAREIVQRLGDLPNYTEEITLPHLWKITKILAHIRSRFPEDQEVLSDIASAYGTLVNNIWTDDDKSYLSYVYGNLKRFLKIENKTGSFKQGLIAGFNGILSNNVSSGKILKNSLLILQGFLNDQDKEIRKSAAQSFKGVKYNTGISQKELYLVMQILFDRLNIENEPAVIKMILSSLSGIAQNENSNRKMMQIIAYKASQFLNSDNPAIGETVMSILADIIKNKSAGFQLKNKIGRILLTPLSGENGEIRKKAANSLGYLVKRYKNIDIGIELALKEYEHYGRYNLRKGYSIEDILKNLEHEDPEIREDAAYEARRVFFRKEVIKADKAELKKIKSWEALNDILRALRISVGDSDYGVHRASDESLKYAGFILEDKEIPKSKQNPILILPASPEVSLSIDRKKSAQHEIFREFLVIPLNNTRDFTYEELNTIYLGLKEIPYSLLGGFYSISADETDFDREDHRARFTGEQIKFKSDKVTMSDLFHEISHSIFENILTAKQRELFAKLNKGSRTDLENYAYDYGMEDIDEDFATMVESWGVDSKVFFDKALKRAMAKKKPILLEKLLIIAEAFAAGSHISSGYKITGNRIKRSYFKISRFNDGKLKTIKIDNKTYNFVYGNDDRLTRINGKMIY